MAIGHAPSLSGSNRLAEANSWGVSPIVGVENASRLLVAYGMSRDDGRQFFLGERLIVFPVSQHPLPELDTPTLSSVEGTRTRSGRRREGWSNSLAKEGPAEAEMRTGELSKAHDDGNQ